MKKIEHLTKEELNLEKKKSSNILNWRGQFSPDFVENILSKYSKKNDLIYDPFIGSGTTAYISLKLNRNIIGTELNPSAFILSSIYKFINLNSKDRLKIIAGTSKFINSKNLNLDIIKLISKINRIKDLNQRILARYLLLVSFNKEKNNFLINIKKNIKKISEIILRFPQSKKKYQLYLSDARKTVIKDKTIDFVLTSPPYINVFNYHQNYREIVEKFDYKILDIAKSELGSNRKFRGNRFNTIIQYSLDIGEIFVELKRICKKNATIIFVVGKVSSIRGVQIRNSKILIEIANLVGFKTKNIQTRCFLNKFGKKIFEDVIIFNLNLKNKDFKKKQILQIPVDELNYVKKKLLNNIKNDILSDIDDTLKNKDKIINSPLMDTYNEKLTNSSP